MRVIAFCIVNADGTCTACEVNGTEWQACFARHHRVDVTEVEGRGAVSTTFLGIGRRAEGDPELILGAFETAIIGLDGKPSPIENSNSVEDAKMVHRRHVAAMRA